MSHIDISYLTPPVDQPPEDPTIVFEQATPHTTRVQISGRDYIISGLNAGSAARLADFMAKDTPEADLTTAAACLTELRHGAGGSTYQHTPTEEELSSWRPEVITQVARRARELTDPDVLGDTEESLNSQINHLLIRLTRLHEKTKTRNVRSNNDELDDDYS